MPHRRLRTEPSLPRPHGVPLPRTRTNIFTATTKQHPKRCEEAITKAGEELTDLKTQRSVTNRELITVVLRLYRQGDRKLRSRCLDIIDRLTELDIYA